MQLSTSLALAALLGLGACSTAGIDDFTPHGSDPTPDDDDTGDDDDSATPGDPCLELADPVAVFGLVEDTLSDKYPTVVTVRWMPSTDQETWVLYGRDGDEMRAVMSEPDGPDGRVATLLGLTTDTSYHFQVVTESPDGLLCTAPAEVTTGPLPAELPELTVDVRDPAAAAGGYTTLILKPESVLEDWLVILDANGDYVWFHRISPGAPRAWLSLDRKAVLINDTTYDPDEDGLVHRIPLDGSPPTSLVVAGAHQDFVEVEPGVIGSIGWDVREFDGVTDLIAGETIVEASEGSAPRVVWSVFDVAEPDPLQPYFPQPGWDPPAGLWAHLNHLHYAPAEDAYYVTSRFLGSVYRIDRATGQTSWILTPQQSPGDGDFQPAGEDPIEFMPHSAVPVEGGVLLFDTSSVTSGGCSAVSEYALDTVNGTADPVWLYATEDCAFCPYLGNAELLWNGNRTLVLATNGRIDEVTADGELVWQLETSAGWWFGYATRTADIYP